MAQYCRHTWRLLQSCVSLCHLPGVLFHRPQPNSHPPGGGGATATQKKEHQKKIKNRKHTTKTAKKNMFMFFPLPLQRPSQSNQFSAQNARLKKLPPNWTSFLGTPWAKIDIFFRNLVRQNSGSPFASLDSLAGGAFQTPHSQGGGSYIFLPTRGRGGHSTF